MKTSVQCIPKMMRLFINYEECKFLRKKEEQLKNFKLFINYEECKFRFNCFIFSESPSLFINYEECKFITTNCTREQLESYSLTMRNVNVLINHKEFIKLLVIH